MRPLGLLGAIAISILIAPAAHAQKAPPPAVVVAPVPVENVAPVSSFIGHVQAIQSVQIVPRVTAFIESEPVAQGSHVKAGQVLFQLQKAQYQAAVQAAQAKLDAAKAALENSQRQYERALKLAKQGFEAKANLDVAIATRDQDQANVLAAQANLAQAALDYGYTTIVSPIEGRIGAITLTKGNLVTPSTPPLATVNQMDPIRVVFSVSDRLLVNVKQRTKSTVEKAAAALNLQLVLPNGTTYDQPGHIAFVNNEVDPQTGTVAVYADFPNPKELLLPGAYVTVNIRRAQPEERPLVPVAAVQSNRSGNYVLVVGAGNKVAQRPIELGRQVAQNYIVTKGLSGGENVIVQGVQKVHPGEVVTPEIAPATPPAPAQSASNEG